MEVLKNIFLFAVIIVITSCASFKTKISDEQAEWSKIIPGDISDISHAIFLVGDAGAATDGQPNPTLDALHVELEKCAKDATLIFLGDNIYPSGMPPEADPDYINAESAMQAQLKAVSNFKGKVYFIPGNHDWYGGMEDLKRQEKYIEKHLGKNSFLPENGCPGPKTIELNDEVTLVIIDSQWFLEDWTEHTDFNETCEVKTRKDFIFEMRDVIRKNKDKFLVIALHHPLESYGRHAGYYSARSHLFPLTDINKGLYLPLPVVGSVFQTFRKNIGKVQDMNHPLYKDFIEGIKKVSAGFDNIVFVSGHEHNQQLIEKDGHYYIVSGIGSKKEEVKMGVGSQYASGVPGFSRLDFYDDGKVWISFFEVGKNGEAKISYRKQLDLDIPDQADFFPEDFPIYYSGEDTIISSIYTNTGNRSGFYKSIFGEHYGELYSLDLKAPVFDLFSYKEGLRPVKRGGGSQTNSLRLELPDGRQYVMRGIRKDVEKLLPKGFARTLASDLLQDQFMSAHPFAAFAIPGLAEAAEVMHTHPKLFFIPKQPGLENYNEYYGDELYLFEERPAGDRSDLENFGHSQKIISTSDLLNELYTDKEAFVDQNAVIRARLFDILINDWDRHDDQWRWALFTENEKEIYRPIPRDRDQAFVKFDGWISEILNNTVPVFGQMRSFDYKIPDVKAICHNARWFDRSFMNELTWEDWQDEVKHLQQSLTQEVIRKSISVWPEEVFEKTGEEVIGKLQARVIDLEKYALEYYEYLYKTVDIIGTEENDTFHLRTLDDGMLEILYSSEGIERYRRVFDKKITDEIRLYGRSGEDVFVINSSIASGIKLFLLGGPGIDLYTSYRPARLLDEVIIRENDDNNKILLNQAKLITSNKPKYYTYNRHSHQYDYNIMFPNFSFNPDDGVMLGMNLSYTKHGFMKWPYSSLHNVSGSVGLAAKSYRFNYSGVFTSITGEKDFLVDVDVFSPQYITNFFGFGNETKVENEDRDFYRIRNRIFALKLSLQDRHHNGGALKYGVFGETRKVVYNENSIIANEPQYDTYYENQTFVGGLINYSLSNLDISHNPSSGVNFFLGAEAKFRPANTKQRFMRLSSEVSIFQEILDGRRIVLGLRSGYMLQWGESDFYQVVTIGGDNQIRGYRSQRFSGQSAFYANSDLRVRIGEVTNYFLPFVYGVNLGFDYGRVWVSEEESSLWHHGYGGGIWLSPFDFATLRVNYFVGDEEGRYTFGLGFFF